MKNLNADPYLYRILLFSAAIFCLVGVGVAMTLKSTLFIVFFLAGVALYLVSLVISFVGKR